MTLLAIGALEEHMKKTLFVSTFAVLATAAVSQAALIAGWNNVPDQWDHEPSANNAATQLNYSSTVGVTEGSHSLQLSSRAGFALLAKNFGPQFNNGLIAAGSATSPVLVAIDVTIPAGSFDTGGTFFEINFPYNGQFTSFTNVLIPAGTIPGSGTRTLFYVLPAGVRGTNPSFFGMFIGVNTNRTPGSGLLYFDNLRVSPIPEPTSLSLIGAAGLALLGRRR